MSAPRFAPVPWGTMYGRGVIRAFDGTDVATVHGSPANAARIVQCVNAHDALVNAARAVDHATRSGDYAAAFDAVRLALEHVDGSA